MELALDLSPDQQMLVLQEQCGDDEILRAQALELLNVDLDDGFLESGWADTGVDPEELLGERIGRIRLDQLRAVGGMSWVYSGTDELLQRPVAVKFMKQPSRAEADSLGPNRGVEASSLREAQVLSKLRHKHICEVHDLTRHRGHAVLVLELIEGPTLRELLSAGKVKDPLQLGLQLCEALAFAHERGVVHRI